MIRVRFDDLGIEAVNDGGRWIDCAMPPLLANLRNQADEAVFVGNDVELDLARLACRAWNGRIVAMSWPRPRSWADLHRATR